MRPNTLRNRSSGSSRQLFGKKAETFVDTKNAEQLYFPGFLDDQFQDVPKTTTIPSHERKKRKSTGKDTISLSDDLPVERQVIDLPEEDKVCSETGKELVKIGEKSLQNLLIG